MCRRRRLQTGVVLLFRIERRAVLGHGEKPVSGARSGRYGIRLDRRPGRVLFVSACDGPIDPRKLPRGRRAPTRSRGNRHAGDENTRRSPASATAHEDHDRSVRRRFEARRGHRSAPPRASMSRTRRNTCTSSLRVSARSWRRMRTSTLSPCGTKQSTCSFWTRSGNSKRRDATRACPKRGCPLLGQAQARGFTRRERERNPRMFHVKHPFAVARPADRRRHAPRRKSPQGMLRYASLRDRAKMGCQSCPQRRLVSAAGRPPKP